MQALLRYFSPQYIKRHVIGNPGVMLRALVLLAAVLGYGTTGFLYFELPGNPDLVWSDALWYSIVTLTTVGYGDFFPKTAGGRFLVGVPLMLIGIGLLGFILSVVANALITAKSKELKGMSQVHLSKHVVLINFPGLPKLLRLLDELAHDPSIGFETPLLLIDRELPELPPELLARGVRYVRGDPTRDDTLQRAAIKSASHAIVLSSPTCADPAAADALNVTITLAIEARTSHVNTVVECQDPGTEELLRKAGCDRVVCSARFEALYVSQELLNPGMQDIVADLLSTSHGQQFYLTPVRLSGAATFAQLAAACAKSGHIALGLKRAHSNLLNLPTDHAVLTDDLAITMGERRVASFSIL